MTLGQQIKKCEKLGGKPKDLPWEIARIFPDIDVSCTGVAFSSNGDYVTILEATEALKLLIKELQ